MFQIDEVKRAITVAQVLARELCAGTDTEVNISVVSESENDAVFSLQLKRVGPCM